MMAATSTSKSCCSAKCEARPQSRKRSTARQRRAADYARKPLKNAKRCGSLSRRLPADPQNAIAGKLSSFAAEDNPRWRRARATERHLESCHRELVTGLFLRRFG